MIKLAPFERSPKLSELKVSYKRQTRHKNERVTSPRIESPKTAEGYLRQIWNQDTIELVEEFVLVCLNNATAPLGWVRISTGGFSGTIVDARLVFGVALQTASSAILVAHNHPAGILSPSDHDRLVTKRLKEAGELLGIRLLDHLILTKHDSFSFLENQLL